MPSTNYRQAKRSREAARKKRQQEKLDRKQNRAVAAPAEPGDAPAAAPETVKTP